MATRESVPQSPAGMTPNQLARRQRLLDAVPALVADGHDEDMSMKEIAEHAGVALGTMYRYFSSKDHLLAAAMLRWAEGLQDGIARIIPDPASGTPAERLTAALHSAVVAYERRPAFARLLVLVANSPDPHASECYAQMGNVVYGALGQAIGDEVDEDRRTRILLVIGAVWYHCLVEWTIGRMTIDGVHDALATAAHLLLPD